MSEPEISRVREDLEVIRQAAGVDLPFSRRDVWIMTSVGCAAGAVLACMGWWVPLEYRWIALLPAAVLIGVWLCLARSAHRRRAAEPARWREMRYGLRSFFLFMPLFVGFIVWEAVSGMPRATVAASALFGLGLGLAWFAVIDRKRRSYLGAALPLMLYGLAIPFCGPHQGRAAAGLMVVGGALTTAAIQMWQLRSQRRNTDVN